MVEIWYTVPFSPRHWLFNCPASPSSVHRAGLQGLRWCLGTTKVVLGALRGAHRLLRGRSCAVLGMMNTSDFPTLSCSRQIIHIQPCLVLLFRNGTLGCNVHPSLAASHLHGSISRSPEHFSQIATVRVTHTASPPAGWPGKVPPNPA